LNNIYPAFYTKLLFLLQVEKFFCAPIYQKSNPIKKKETAAGDARFLQHINTFNQIKKYEKNYNLNSYVFPYLDCVKIV